MTFFSAALENDSPHRAPASRFSGNKVQGGPLGWGGWSGDPGDIRDFFSKSGDISAEVFSGAGGARRRGFEFPERR